MIHNPPKKLRPKDELTLGWLNRVLAILIRNNINLGSDSGLEMNQNEHGTWLRVVSQDPAAAFYANPSGSISGASGSWPNLTPATTTADVYQDQDGKLVKVEANATIQNYYPAATAAAKVLSVIPNGYGMWNVVAQSCT